MKLFMDPQRINNEEKNRELCGLMAAAQNGDAEAYEQLLRQIATILRGYLGKRMGPTLMEDVIQDVLVSIHGARHTYDPARPFFPWMFAIARFRLADFWREMFRRTRFETGLEDGQDYPATESFEQNTELQHSVRAALAGLNERQRQLVQKLKLEGLSIRDVARDLKMSEAAVKVAAHRAYKALRQKLEEDFSWIQTN